MCLQSWERLIDLSLKINIVPLVHLTQEMLADADNIFLLLPSQIGGWGAIIDLQLLLLTRGLICLYFPLFLVLQEGGIILPIQTLILHSARDPS